MSHPFDEDEPLVDIWTEDFGFCGCGISEECVKVVREVLEVIADDGKRNYQHIPELPKKYPEEFAYILMYLLDSKGYIEHGVGVMPGWLTDKGKVLLEKIKKAIENTPKEVKR